jgi:predicted RNA-binding protein YlqC (UPF0109 family)
MPDERDVPKLVEQRQAFAGLFGRENVLEFLEANRRAVTELHAEFVESDLVRELLQPTHVLGGEKLRVEIERVARRLVVVRVVHATGDRGVVVSEDGRDDQIAHQIRALVRRASVTHGVPEAIVAIDALALERLHDGCQGFVVCVDVAEDAQPHEGG